MEKRKKINIIIVSIIVTLVIIFNVKSFVENKKYNKDKDWKNMKKSEEISRKDDKDCDCPGDSLLNEVKKEINDMELYNVLIDNCPDFDKNKPHGKGIIYNNNNILVKVKVASSEIEGIKEGYRLVGEYMEKEGRVYSEVMCMEKGKVDKTMWIYSEENGVIKKGIKKEEDKVIFQ